MAGATVLGNAFGAGDVNDDGYDDVVGGDGEADTAQLYLGAPAGLAVAPTVTWSGAAGDAFGVVVASAGDANGDGYDDVWVGAPYSDVYAGRAYLFLGGPEPIAATAAANSGGAIELGYRAANAGDRNGDGLGDVVLGDANSTAFDYLGSPVPAAEATSVFPGAAADSSVTGGDFDGDGLTDIAIGRPFPHNMRNPATVTVLYGFLDLDRDSIDDDTDGDGLPDGG